MAASRTSDAPEPGAVTVCVVEQREKGVIVLDEAEAARQHLGALTSNLYDDWDVRNREDRWVEVGRDE